ncbi:MAG: hypothetical protein FJW37_04925 [Acidobacteria bacterium]|nr:hypothetical protein [Acidobacteriota bacterium]
MIAAILRAQWLSMRSFRLRPQRRGAALSLVTGVIWYGFWILLAAFARQFTSGPENPARIRTALPTGLLFMLLYWHLAPLVSASLGASLDLRKLRVYPIPHSKLFVVEVLLRVSTCTEMLLILAGGVLGLFQNPAFFRSAADAPRILGPILLLVLFNLFVAAGMRNLLERLLAMRRLREVLILALVLLAGLPRLLVEVGVSLAPLRAMFSRQSYGFWPWVAAGRAALGIDVLYGLGVLGLWTAAGYLFGRWQFERNLRHDAQASLATRVKPGDCSWAGGLYRIPSLLLPDPAAAIVEKELRTLARTPRFRMVFLMGCTFGLVVGLPLVFGRRHTGSLLADNFLARVSVYALTLLGQVSYSNSFGFDRSAAQFWFTVPVSLGATLLAKNLASGIFILLEILAVLAACWLLRVEIEAAHVLEALLVTAIAALYMLSLGNLASVHYPRPMNPDKISQGGAAGRFQALLFVLYPVALAPVFLAYLARHLTGRQPFFYLVLGFGALVGVIVYRLAMESAAETARRRRDILLAELSRGEGPVLTE